MQIVVHRVHRGALTALMVLWSMTVPFAYIRYRLLAIEHHIYGGHREPAKSLWRKQNCRPVFTATMSRVQYETVLRLMRFDVREQTDATAIILHNSSAIRSIQWCRDNCCLSDRVTIDETLRKFKFRGRVNSEFICLKNLESMEYYFEFHLMPESVTYQECCHTPVSGRAPGCVTATPLSLSSIVKELCQHFIGSGLIFRVLEHSLSRQIFLIS